MILVNGSLLFGIAILGMIYISRIDKYFFTNYKIPYPSIALIHCYCLFLFFILPSFVFIAEPILSERFRSRFNYDVEIYLYGMVGGVAAVAFYYAAYLKTVRIKVVFPHIRFGFSRFQQNLERFPSGALAFLVITTLLYLGYTVIFSDDISVGYGDGNYREQHSSMSNRIMGLLTDIFKISSFLLVLLVYQMRKWGWLVLLFILYCSPLLLGGSRLSLHGFLGIFLPFIVVMIYGSVALHGELKSRSVVTIGTIVLPILFFLLMVKSAYRLSTNLQLTDLYEIIVMIDFHLVREAIVDFLLEISGTDLIAIILTRQASGVAPQMGSTYAIIFTAFIPGLLLSTKPETTLSTWFGDNYWFTAEEVAMYGAGIQGNIFFILGETFINFGSYAFLAIPFIYMFLGFLVARFTRFVFSEEARMVGLCVLALTFHEWAMTTTTLAALLSNTVKQVLLVTIYVSIFNLLFALLPSKDSEKFQGSRNEL